MGATDKDSDGDATQGGTIATDTTDTCHDQEPFSFMGLPPELRLMVYHFALQDITDPILFPGSEYAQKPHRCRGALAIIHTSKQIRRESYDAMRYIVRTHSFALHEACVAIAERNVRLLKSTGFETAAYDQMVDDHDRATCQVDCIEVVTQIMHKVFMANIADHEAQRDARMATLLLQVA